jgi:hypothetical protein
MRAPGIEGGDCDNHIRVRTKMRAVEQPHELAELDARIARLRKRLTAGDPDMTPEEVQAAVDRAERKRRERADAPPAESRETAKLLTILPNAAELYRRQIALGTLFDLEPR